MVLRSISPVNLLVKPFYDVYISIYSLGISLEAFMTRNVLKSTWSIRAPGGLVALTKTINLVTGVGIIKVCEIKKLR